jgi:hypothetical protein
MNNPEQPIVSHGSATLIDYRLNLMEKSLSSISDSLRQLANLEQKHAETRDSLNRAFDQIKDLSIRLNTMELEMPTLKLIRGWNIAGVVGILGLVGISIIKLVFLKE